MSYMISAKKKSDGQWLYAGNDSREGFPLWYQREFNAKPFGDIGSAFQWWADNKLTLGTDKVDIETLAVRKRIYKTVRYLDPEVAKRMKVEREEEEDNNDSI